MRAPNGSNLYLAPLLLVNIVVPWITGTSNAFPYLAILYLS